MTEELKARLIFLADKYEVPSFCDQDPSQFLRWYKAGAGASLTDVEAASFIAAMLAFGNRKQFIPKISQILSTADSASGSLSKWLLSHSFESTFPHGSVKFYRFYSYDDMQTFFCELAAILQALEHSPFPAEGAFGSYFHRLYNSAVQAPATPQLADLISQAFPKSKIVPKGKNSANKRVHMFLRWMVRPNSSVDLGLWTWYNPENLLIPLDVHVMQEAISLGLLPAKATASRRTAQLLTAELSQVFPKDPVRGDFSLFGLGINEK